MKVFFMRNVKIIFIIKFEKYIANISFYNIMINKFSNK